MFQTTMTNATHIAVQRALREYGGVLPEYTFGPYLLVQAHTGDEEQEVSSITEKKKKDYVLDYAGLYQEDNLRYHVFVIISVLAH